ncbi:Sister chromatid cohesion protein 2 [Agyrium rufum]|nr:Sister chromatid cohesion protein 2 [Agyrium rufum]
MPPLYNGAEVLPPTSSLMPTSSNRGMPPMKIPNHFPMENKNSNIQVRVPSMQHDVKTIAPSLLYVAPPNMVSKAPAQINIANPPAQRNTLQNAHFAQKRPLTVYEALQYTPFTSVLPFDSTIVPIPSSDHPAMVSASYKLTNDAKFRQHLDQHSSKLHPSYVQTEEGRALVSTLGDLIDGSSLSEYKLKLPKGMKLNAVQGPANQQSTSAFKDSLSPLARMVLESSHVAFRYPTFESPKPTARNYRPEQKAVLKLNAKSNLGNAIHSATKPLNKPLNHASTQSPVESKTLATPRLSSSIAIVVPPPPSTAPQAPLWQENNNWALNANRKQSVNSDTIQVNIPLYPIVKLPPAPASSQDFELADHLPPSSAKKRKRDDTSYESTAPVRVYDPTEVSSIVLRNLEDVMEDIFEAENDAQAQHQIRNDQILQQSGESFTLTTATHGKLESCIQKTVNAGRYAEIPIENIVRLQILCDPGLELPAVTKLSEDHDQWLDSVEEIEKGLRCARTVLRSMTGGRQDRRIYAEETLEKILRIIKEAINSFITPIIECRASDSRKATKNGVELPGTSDFEFLSFHKKPLSQLMHATSKVMGLLCSLVNKVELSENTINSIEPLVTDVLFGDNAQSEKDSILGNNKFETIRRFAMDIMTEIFAKYPDQRKPIFGDIFSSLQKLPIARQHARQFKMRDGKGVQVVSALLVRLVQISGIQSKINRGILRKRRLPGINAQLDGNGSGSDFEEDSGRSDSAEDSGDEPLARQKGGNATSSQTSLTQKLYQSALSSAHMVVHYFVAKASTASKTGEEKHRQLLDIFIEDLLVLVGHPEWSATEIILQSLVSQLNELITSDKTSAPAKNMVLELFGTMACAITDMTFSAEHLSRTSENDESSFSKSLVQLMDDTVSGQVDNNTLTAWNGVYRVVMESILPMGRDDNYLQSAQAFLLTQWCKAIVTSRTIAELASNDVNAKLFGMLSDGRWINQGDLLMVSPNQARLAYSLVLLNMGFCRSFGHLLKTLLDSITSDQISVRTRSLKSITQMLEKDPKILDRARHVIDLIVNCIGDKSPMVRESALTLVGKCVQLRPTLDLKVCKPVLVCATDDAIGVRKRAMKLLKEMYARSERQDLTIIITETLLLRVNDLEDSVVEVAKQTFEELFFSPDLLEGSVRAQIKLKKQLTLLARLCERGDHIVSASMSLLRQTLAIKASNHDMNKKVCQLLVAGAFDVVIAGEEGGEDGANNKQILHLLTIFAKTSPKLFTKPQVGYLQPYIKNLANADELNLFRSVVIILRCVLPTLSALQKDTLKQIQDDLLRNITKLAKTELNEVVACLWTINGELQNADRLINLVGSILNKLRTFKETTFQATGSEQQLSQVRRFIVLASHFGRHCDFESYLEKFTKVVPWVKGQSIASALIDSILPFALEQQPLSLRSAAFDGIGMICQAWPAFFNRRDIAPIFQSVLRDDHPGLQKIVLGSFRDFFTQHGVATTAKEGSERDPQHKLGASLTATDTDSAASLIAQGFLDDVLRIALESQEDYALTATEVITSISRQGLVHPKQCGPALIALETSTNSRIAQLAYNEHLNVHQKHELTFEREYMRAVQEAYSYQQKVVKDISGAVGHPPRAKLHPMYEVIKTSKGKFQTKFLSDYCKKINFDLSDLRSEETGRSHLQLTRFFIENLAFFEYGRIEDLKCALTCMERIAAGTGAGLAHAINTEILQINIDATGPTTNGAIAHQSPNGFQANGEAIQVAMQTSVPQPGMMIEPIRLRQLATGSLILSILWEARTFLRRLYGLQSNSNTSNAKMTKASNTKDVSKAPTKVHGIIGDKLVASISNLMSSTFGSEESMVSICKSFAEIINVDDELKVGDEDDMIDGLEAVTRFETPSMDGEEDGTSMPGSGKGKKKGSANGLNGVGGEKKKRGRPSLGGRKRSGKGKKAHDDDDGMDEDW